MKIRTLLLLCVALCIPSTAAADDWAPARLTHIFSQDGDRFVRIVPGDSVGETYGFAGSPKGKWGHAELYTRRADRSFTVVADVDLRNPVAPVEAFISNDGRLITFDNWHNVGHGEAVVIYDAKGKLVRSYRLEDLYAKDVLAKVSTSVSSRWWRCPPMHFVQPVEKQTEMYVHEFNGGYFVFNLITGDFEYTAGQAKCREGD